MTQAELQLPGFETSAPEADSDERYTTRETLDWCMRVAQVDAFDLDVAACEEAHCAPKFYAKADDGLARPWLGRVWCNPPFSNIELWVLRAWQAMSNKECELVAMLLPANRTEQPWWQHFIEPRRDQPNVHRPWLRTRYLPGRTRFGFPGNREGVGVGSPPFSCVLLVWSHS